MNKILSVTLPVLSLFCLSDISMADVVSLAEGDTYQCPQQNEPKLNIEEVNADFEIFTDANAVHWCEVENRWVVYGKCRGIRPTLKSSVTTKNATYVQTGEVYSSELNELVYEGTCVGSCKQPEVSGSGICEAKVTKDTDGNITAVKCESKATPTPTPTVQPTATPTPTPTPYVDPCEGVKAPTQGRMWKTINTPKGRKTWYVGYSCVKTQNPKANAKGTYEGDMFGWHARLYYNNYGQMISAAIKGENTPMGWDDDRQFSKTARANAKAAYDSGNYCYVCASIRINGCFAPDTNITLADGSAKRADQIAIGDELFNPVTRQAVKVERVVEGPEDKGLIKFTTKAGTLKVSQDHPMLTTNGLKQAKNVTAADILINGDNEQVKIDKVEELAVEEGQYVVNFILEGADMSKSENRMLLSDGLITGDLQTQIELATENE